MERKLARWGGHRNNEADHEEGNAGRRQESPCKGVDKG